METKAGLRKDTFICCSRKENEEQKLPNSLYKGIFITKINKEIQEKQVLCPCFIKVNTPP